MTELTFQLAIFTAAGAQAIENELPQPQDEAAVRQLIAAEKLSYVVVPDATQYAATSWLRQPREG